jgi:hypothetical protein
MSVQYWNQRYLCTFQLLVCTNNWNAQLTVTSCFSSWISWSMNMGPIGSSETSVRNPHDTLRNIPEGFRSHLLHSKSQKSCLIVLSYLRLYEIFSGMTWLKHVNVYIYIYIYLCTLCMYTSHTRTYTQVCVCVRMCMCSYALCIVLYYCSQSSFLFTQTSVAPALCLMSECD